MLLKKYLSIKTNIVRLPYEPSSELLRVLQEREQKHKSSADAQRELALVCGALALYRKVMEGGIEPNTRIRQAVEEIGKSMEDIYQCLIKLGSVLYDNVCYKGALRAYKEAAKIKPNDVDANYNIGVAYLALGQFENAIEPLQSVVSMDTNNARAYLNLGVAYHALGRFEEAIGAYERTISIDPNREKAFNNLGGIYIQLQRFEDAVDLLERAVQIDPQNAKSYVSLGAACYLLKRYDDAIRAFEEATRINPDYIEAHNNLGLAYRESGRYLDASKAFLKAGKTDLAGAYLRIHKSWSK